jgi:hypothetical protein
LSRVLVSFDEPNLVPVAGLLPAAVLSGRIELAELVDQRVALACDDAHRGTKALNLLGSVLFGEDSCDAEAGDGHSR